MIIIPRTDSEKLRYLADWFDRQDAHGRLGAEPAADEVQQDLRRIAEQLETPPPLTREISDAITHSFVAATIPSEMTRGLIERGVFAPPVSEES